MSDNLEKLKEILQADDGDVVALLGSLSADLLAEANIGQVDQLKAMARDVTASMRLLGETAIFALHRTRDDVSAPLVACAGRTMKGLLSAMVLQTVRLCAHIDIGRPQGPVVVTAWMSDYLWCGQPTCGLATVLHGEEDSRCDGCGKVVTGIWPTTFQLGLILVQSGLCDVCKGASEQ